ncbi:hypothetical protein D9M71_500150 [compost metagenome]
MKFLRILWAIDTSQVKNEFRLLNQPRQMFQGIIAGKTQNFNIGPLTQMSNQILANKPVGTGNQNLHCLLLGRGVLATLNGSHEVQLE